MDFLICYEHPALSNPLTGQRFRHVTLANDRLMPVARVDAAGRVRHGPAPLNLALPPYDFVNPTRIKIG